MKPPVLHASFLLDGFPNKRMKRRWEVSCRSGTYWTNPAKRRKTLRLRAICRRCCTCNFNCSPPCRLRFPVQIQTLSWRDVSQLSDGHSKCLLRIPNLTLARPLIVNPAIIWTLAVVLLSQSNYRLSILSEMLFSAGSPHRIKELTSIWIDSFMYDFYKLGGNQAGKICVSNINF